jgi:hypothetical protein
MIKLRAVDAAIMNTAVGKYGIHLHHMFHKMIIGIIVCGISHHY